MPIIPLHLHSHWRGWRAAQLSLSFGAPPLELPDPTLRERAEWEREILGPLVSVHPLQLVAAELAQHALTRSDQLIACAGREVKLAGVRLAAHRFNGRQQEPMLLVDMEDEAGLYQVLWSGAALQEYGGV
ncbi:MAG TPA: hypothetical protein VJG32_19215 [Anaerolineae bacterium]|nr:hypothetical protein [Anaerolineae bacterium]